MNTENNKIDNNDISLIQSARIADNREFLCRNNRERIIVVEQKVDNLSSDVKEIKKLASDIHVDVIEIKTKQRHGVAAFIGNNFKTIVGIIAILACGGGVPGIIKLLELIK